MIQKIRTRLNEIRLNTLFFFRKYRLAIQTPKEEVAHLLPEVKIAKKWYGSSYGGFFVCPDYLSKQSIVYSFGIGKDISFDKKIIAKHGCTVFGFDPTPKSIAYIASLAPNPGFRFHPFGIAKNSGIEHFYLPKDQRGVSGSMAENTLVDTRRMLEVEMKSLSDIIASLGHERIDVLKMDIEGSEYELIDSILETKVFIGQILLEFHDRLFPTDFPASKATAEKLHAHGYRIFAKSISSEEISFIHQSLLPSLNR